MFEQHLMIESDEARSGSAMETFSVRPDGDGPFPLVVFLMDAPGKREELHDMARRIAADGYAVLLPNLYYRTVDHFELDFASKESLSEMWDLMGALGNKAVSRDVGRLLEHAATDTAIDESAVGVVGYCMSGPFAVWAAAEHTNVVRAAASIYGVRLIVDQPDSPHSRLGEVTGELYIAPAEHDDYITFADIDRFEAEMQSSGTAGRVERYWGVHHGFAFPGRTVYDESAAERHWTALLDLFARNLDPAST